MRTEGMSDVSTPAAPRPTLPGPAAGPPELLGTLQALLQAYGELQARLTELEQQERLRVRPPRPHLGIDY